MINNNSIFSLAAESVLLKSLGIHPGFTDTYEHPSKRRYIANKSRVVVGCRILPNSLESEGPPQRDTINEGHLL